MLRLTARFADIWNRDFDAASDGYELYSAADLASSQERMEAACAVVGRDPSTLARTAAVRVDLPDVPPRVGWGALAGSPEQIAAGLRRFADAGFSQVQVWVHPSGLGGLEAFAPVLDILAQV
jgi:alkanesulfonate monooxygenase SsuD/methylene tetrahydromethanopterin reductase-like flavin-dependent oxidoreductase (luciferase family)